MNRRELEEITKHLLGILKVTGYTGVEAGDILEASGKLIQELRNEKSKQANSKANDRVQLYNDRLSTL
jgi:hypothetical protein